MRLIDADSLIDKIREEDLDAVGIIIANTFIDLINKQPTLGPWWTSTKDKMPEKNGPYLIAYDFGKYTPTKLSLYQDGEFYNQYFQEVTKHVAAWMPLPEYYN